MAPRPRFPCPAAALAVLVCAAAAPAQAVVLPRPSLLVLDDCDPDFRGKDAYDDGLRLVEATGRVAFRAGGLNGCQMSGNSHLLAVDARRGWVWVAEYVAGCVHRYDRGGQRLATINGLRANALAVDPETGNLWALAGPGRIGEGETAVYDAAGNRLATHPVSGWDLAYSPVDKAFWIAEQHLSRIGANHLGPVRARSVIVKPDIAPWCVKSVDVDPKTGQVWVAVPARNARELNQVVAYSAGGKLRAAVNLKDLSPCRVSVDPKDGSAWVALFRTAVHRYTADGRLDGEFAHEALAVQAEPAGGGAWVVTTDEVLRIARTGEVLARVRHRGPTGQAWVAAW